MIDSSNEYILPSVDKRGIEVLPKDFVPGACSVICQRGKECYDHVGNQRFRMIIKLYVDEYMNSTRRVEKSKIVSKIVNNINNSAAGAGFVRKDFRTKRWYKVLPRLAKEKVSQALRDGRKTNRRPGNGKAEKRHQHLHKSEQKLFAMTCYYQLKNLALKNFVKKNGITDVNSQSKFGYPSTSCYQQAQNYPFLEKLPVELEPTPFR